MRLMLSIAHCEAGQDLTATQSTANAARHRRPGPPARCPGDSAADHAAMVLEEKK